MPYRTTIGLEVHAELKTRTKMFCDSKNDPNEMRPNANVCPVCFGHPGTLPVINKEAIKHILKFGVAIEGELADFTEFDRKNYFYPDLPKGYQISQYKFPLVTGGSLNGISLTRVHLEEDTARSTHVDGGYSYVDFNRAGVPLMELVTEPVIHTPEEAVSFARELQLLLRYLGASDANMEKGEMRVEANVSVSDSENLGTKVEVKNLNSFRSVERAILYEMTRHINLLSEGKRIVQETRGWSEETQMTYAQRLKEESHDYRFFPEPDIPKLYISDIAEFKREVLINEIPELPAEKRLRYIADYELRPDVVETFIRDETLQSFFEAVVNMNKGNIAFIKLAANYLTSDIAGLVNSRKDGIIHLQNITPDAFKSLVEMLLERRLNSRSAKNILIELFEIGGVPEAIALRDGLFQMGDAPELGKIIDTVMKEYPDVAGDYHGGKTESIQFFIGKVMKKAGGIADPVLVRKIVEIKLNNSRKD